MQKGGMSYKKCDVKTFCECHKYRRISQQKNISNWVIYPHTFLSNYKTNETINQSHGHILVLNCLVIQTKLQIFQNKLCVPVPAN